MAAHDHLFKLLLIGDSSVGKSSLLLRSTEGIFDEENIQNTIGVDFKIKFVDLDGRRIKLTIWDTAGQERFRTLTVNFYKGAHGVIMVYDVTRRDTFESLNRWLDEVELYSSSPEHVAKILVGNKLDKERMVPREEAEAWAAERGMLYVEASAKTEVGINQTFTEVVQKILETPELLQKKEHPGLKLGEAGGEEAGGCGC